MRLPSLTALALCAAAAPTVAQGGSQAASPDALLRAAGVSAVGGEASSESFTLRVRGGVAAVPPTASESFRIAGGSVGVGGLQGFAGPLVLGTLPGSGPAAGGEQTYVVGYGFQEPGAGAAAVTFDGLPADGSVVLSNTLVRVTAPGGTDAFGNPLGAVAVALSNGLGAASAERAYRYRPTLELLGDPAVGGTASLRVLAEPGQLVQLAVSGGSLGFALPVAPFAGGLTLALPAKTLPLGVANGAGVFARDVPVPDDPSFAGAVLHAQGVAITVVPSLGGSFTNAAAFALLP